ncbi:hypothetical protein NA78x_004047 [Anatilimnocola sp. NA78]|uniref:hypothetical protein n=1 Tax=Anatilimnocola sp. NA78 TaxID=3415683 RepID=UPI003CE55E25
MSDSSEKISVACPQCFKRLSVPATTVGKKARCPNCQMVFRLEPICDAEVVPELAPLPSWNEPAAHSNAWGQPTPPAPYGYDQQSSFQPAAPPLPTSNFPQTQFTSLSVNSNPYQSPSYQKPAYSKRKSRGLSNSALGGMAAMAIALVWFFGGLALGVIFIYPPIMFVIGFCSMIGGLAGGSSDD